MQFSLTSFRISAFLVSFPQQPGEVDKKDNEHYNSGFDTFGDFTLDSVLGGQLLLIEERVNPSIRSSLSLEDFQNDAVENVYLSENIDPQFRAKLRANHFIQTLDKNQTDPKDRVCKYFRSKVSTNIAN